MYQRNVIDQVLELENHWHYVTTITEIPVLFDALNHRYLSNGPDPDSFQVRDLVVILEADTI